MKPVPSLSTLAISLAVSLACGPLAGCSGKDGTLTVGTDTGGQVGDTGGSDTGDTGSEQGTTGTGSTSATCNTANEDCAPGTCGGEGGTMLPGADCLACHKVGGANEAPPFGIGGTVFTDIFGTSGASGVTVRVTDATGKVVELTSNSVGNFYTTQTVTPPLTAEVEVGGNVRAMATQPDTGACNSCHKCDGAAGGKLYQP